MNLYCKTTALLFFIVLMYNNQVAAQTGNNFVAGIGAGTFVYQGDLVPSDAGGYRRLHPAIQLYVGKWANPFFQFRVGYDAGKISAYDADYSSPSWKQARNLRFSASLHKLSARIVFSPLGNTSLTPDRHLYPYLFAGAGATFARISRDWSHMSSSMLESEKMANALAADSAAQLPSTLLSLPFGAGMSYSVSPRISLFGEAAYHLPVTDYLDGFSRIANNKKNDNYYQLSVGVNYTFFKNNYTRCPRVVW